MEGTVSYQQFIELPPLPMLTALLDLHLNVFGGQTCDEIMTEMVYYHKRNLFLMDLAMSDGRVIGYKAGYERKPGHFYSWLGCVDPVYRGQRIADTLMRRQHDWCRLRGYSSVRTQTYNRWRGMLILNLKYGFDIIGTQQGAHGLIILLEKQLLAD